MNDPQTLFFVASHPDNEMVITAEIVGSEVKEAENLEIKGVIPDNQTLLATLARLQQELAETNERMETQSRRLRSCDTLLARQNEELQYERGQLQRAIAEVESYREIERNQQRAIATLSGELAGAREQLASLERECTLLQENYNERVQRAISADREVEELRSRLQRQQHYTLQYKTALEQCAGVGTGATPATAEEIDSPPSAIEPWSSDREQREELAIAVGNEGVIEDDIEEFLAEFERIERSDRSDRGRNDWPSPVISPYIPRYPSIRVDLPTFVKNRPDPRTHDELDC